MSDFRRMSPEAVAARLRRDVDTLVILHRRPDGDAIGSGFALCLLLRALGCRALCVCDDDIPDRLRFLTSSAPHRQPSILREALPADFKPAQILAVDTASPAQMGRLWDTYGKQVNLMIDHHERGDMFADGWVDGQIAASGEMVFRLSRALVEFGRIPAVPNGVDRLLYAAISSDTGCFRFSNATPSTHRVAAALLESSDFDAADINHRLFELRSPLLLRAEHLGYERLRLFAGSRIGLVDFPFDLKQKNGLSDEHLETLVDIPRALEKVEVAVAIRQPSDAPIFRVSMRASGRANVADVCAAFGGGGHTKAAGCTLEDPKGLEHAIDRLVAAIEAVL